MTNIRNGLFSKLLMKYPNLWGVNSEWINWDLAAKQLAADFMEQLGHLITTIDVRNKVKAIKFALKNLNKLDNSKEITTTKLQAYLWYALKLGLRHAADKITKRMIYDGKLKERKYSGHLQYFDNKDKVDKRWLPHINELTEQNKKIRDLYPKDFVKVEEIVDETEDLVMETGEPATNNIIQSPANIDLNIVYEQGLATRKHILTRDYGQQAASQNKDCDTMILNAQVIYDANDLDTAHSRKKVYYNTGTIKQAFCNQYLHRVLTTDSITLSWRGVWSNASVNELV
uniref:Uncharacterized protein n=1 Tax=Glossina austeni TaxID=7395 RepID=A0A1A9VU17_GLOAU